MNKPNEDFKSVVDKNLTIKVVGLGGAGCNVLRHLATTTLSSHFQLIAADTDARAIAQFSQGLALGQKMTRGLGTGGDPEVGRAAAMAQAEDLKILCGGTDIIFLVGGLGGGLATGAIGLMAQAAKDAGALVLAIVTLPFDFEGVRRQRQAQQGLQQLKPIADAVICLPNQGFGELFDQNASIVEVFERSNQLIAQNIFAIWRLAAQPGLIKLDFADLCSVTRGRHTESSSATVEAEGEDRSETVVEKLFSHPFLRDEKLLRESEAVLVSFAAGSDLTMKEVNGVMERINSACANAHIVFGVAVDEQLGNKMSVTLIVSRRGKLVEHSADEEPLSRFGGVDEKEEPAEDHRASRFSPPAPMISDEKKEKLFKQKSRPRSRKKIMMQQGQLPLEIISRGRFEKSEPTIHQGEDLDVPTYLRKNVALN
ncbi:MAG: Cell division protein FtsZ [Verrucomicrobiales bacterium]|nr:Cell division protein FtsZ [Verrucomicrobiales bacterium]